MMSGMQLVPNKWEVRLAICLLSTVCADLYLPFTQLRGHLSSTWNHSTSFEYAGLCLLWGGCTLPKKMLFWKGQILAVHMGSCVGWWMVTCLLSSSYICFCPQHDLKGGHPSHNTLGEACSFFPGLPSYGCCLLLEGLCPFQGLFD
jgi:hypothetical protein